MISSLPQSAIPCLEIQLLIYNKYNVGTIGDNKKKITTNPVHYMTGNQWSTQVPHVASTNLVKLLTRGRVTQR